MAFALSRCYVSSPARVRAALAVSLCYIGEVTLPHPRGKGGVYSVFQTVDIAGRQAGRQAEVWAVRAGSMRVACRLCGRMRAVQNGLVCFPSGRRAVRRQREGQHGAPSSRAARCSAAHAAGASPLPLRASVVAEVVPEARDGVAQ